MEDQIIFELWDATLGADAARAPAVALKSGKLFVTVDTPVRLHTLTLRKRELLKKMNVALGAQGPLSDIILRLGTVSPSDDNA